jgi:hypothetical protein
MKNNEEKLKMEARDLIHKLEIINIWLKSQVKTNEETISSLKRDFKC